MNAGSNQLLARLRWLLPITAVAIVMCSAVDARAAELKFRACSPQAAAQDQQSTAVGLFGRTWAPYAVTGSCPAGLGFDTSQPVTEGKFGFWGLTAPGGMQIDSISMSIEGGLPDVGIEYTIEACANTCTQLRTLPLGLPGASQRIDLDHGKGAALQVRATCRQASCPAGNTLQFRDVVLTTHDDSPPRAQILNLRPGWMRRRDFSANYSVTDWPGVGITWQQVRVDRPESGFVGPGCSMEDPFDSAIYLPLTLPCPPRTPDTPIQLPTLADGVHTVTVDAIDAVGNRMTPLTQEFKLDDAPPGTPIDAVVEPQKNGWASQANLSASWWNPGEKYESKTESGLSYANYSVVPRGTPATAPVRTLIWNLGVIQSTIADLSVPGDGAWDLHVWTEDWAGNIGGRAKVQFGLDRNRPEAPQLIETPWLSRDAIERGVEQQWVQPQSDELESGICGYAFGVGQEITDLDPEITVGGAVTSAEIAKDAPSGESWILARAVSCAGLASPTAAQRLRIDEAPPELTIETIPETSWSKSPAQVVLAAADNGSGVRSIQYRLEGSPPTTIDAAVARVELPDGVHTMSAVATDNAGNKSREISRRVQIDTRPPKTLFSPIDPSRPTQIHARVIDSVSRVASAAIQLLALDASSPTWQTLPTSAVPNAKDEGVLELTTSLADDSLAPGRYRIRAVSSDIAGNVEVSERPASPGFPANLVLPLRGRPALTTALAKESTRCKRAPDKCKRRAGIDYKNALQSRTISYGAKVHLIGEFSDPGGSPMANAELAVYSETNAADGSAIQRVHLKNVTTDERGKFGLQLPRGASRRLIVRFGGSDLLLPSESQSILGVEAGVSFTANKRRARVGDEIRFSGRLLSPALVGSPARVHVQLMFWNGSRWQEGLDSDRTDYRGKFEMSYRPKNPYQLYVKAVVKSERSAWPFMDGESRRVLIRVTR